MVLKKKAKVTQAQESREEDIQDTCHDEEEKAPVSSPQRKRGQKQAQKAQEREKNEGKIGVEQDAGHKLQGNPEQSNSEEGKEPAALTDKEFNKAMQKLKEKHENSQIQAP